MSSNVKVQTLHTHFYLEVHICSFVVFRVSRFFSFIILIILLNTQLNFGYVYGGCVSDARCIFSLFWENNTAE